MNNKIFLIICIAVFCASPSVAGTVDVTVYGYCDPWLAGMPDGSGASFGDTAPGESPMLVTGLALTTGNILTFSATGSVSNSGTPSGLTPDGGSFSWHTTFPDYQPENGISNVHAPISSLLGVFLGSSVPTSSPNSNYVDFGITGLNFTTLSPQLGQVFFIGDGLTGTGSGPVQEFVLPQGATRLFLGPMDGYDWKNNYGSFDVTVTETSAVPAPGGLLLLSSGLLGLAGVRKKMR